MRSIFNQLFIPFLIFVFIFIFSAVITFVIYLTLSTDYEEKRQELELALLEYNKKIQEENEFKEKYKLVLKYTKDLDRIREELEYIPEDYHAKVLALCWTESHLKYNISHPWNDSTTGICGIKSSFWKNYVSKHHVEVNSLYAGYLVLIYLEGEEQDFTKAVKKYKGAKKNFSSVNKVLSLYEKIK